MTRPAKIAAPTGPAADAARAATVTDSGIARICSEQLFGGAREVQIVHLGAIYRLRQTALRKLILTK
jgi:hemin uptake protein HemP